MSGLGFTAALVGNREADGWLAGIKKEKKKERKKDCLLLPPLELFNNNTKVICIILTQGF